MIPDYEVIGQNYAITKHDIAQILGRGSFADVFKCHQITPEGKLSPEVLVAKRVYFQPNVPSMRKLMESEIKLMLDLIVAKNEHVVKIYDYFDSPAKDNSMYIIMEYCEGGDLDKYVEHRGILKEEEIASILFQIAQ